MQPQGCAVSSTTTCFDANLVVDEVTSVRFVLVNLN